MLHKQRQPLVEIRNGSSLGGGLRAENDGHDAKVLPISKRATVGFSGEMRAGIPPPLKPGGGMGNPFGGDWFSQELQKGKQANTDAQWLWSGGLKPGGLRWKNGIVLSNPPV